MLWVNCSFVIYLLSYLTRFEKSSNRLETWVSVTTAVVILSYSNCASAQNWWNILQIEIHFSSEFNIILSLAYAEMVVFPLSL